MQALLEWGIRLIQNIQSLGPSLDGPMAFFTFLGTIEFYLLLLPFIYWNLNPALGFRLLLVLISTDAVSTSFKQLFRQPRPYWVGDVSGKVTEFSYGAPSSHASDSLAVWGYLAQSYRQLWVWALAGFLIIFIALSRLYLGVHFPHDLAAGWLIALVVLLLFPAAEMRIKDRLGSASLPVQITAALLATLLIPFIGFAVSLVTAGLPDPPAWGSFSSEARSLTHYFTLAGASFGAVAGYAVLRRRFSYQAAGPWHLKLLRYFLGLVGVFLIWQGLDAAFGLMAPDESIPGYALRFVRYAGTTVWAMLGAPALFLRLRLASAADPAPARPRQR